MQATSQAIVQQYFDRKRSLASGIWLTGNSVGVFLWPPLSQMLIDRFAWQGALIVESGLMLNGLVCGALFRPPKDNLNTLTMSITNKEPSSIFRNLVRMCSRSYLAFAIFLVALYCIIMGHNCMIVHIILKGKAENISKYRMSMLVSVMGIAGIFGRPACGWIGDFKKMNRTLMVALSAIACGTLNLLTTANKTFPLLAVICTLSGIFSSKYIVL